MKLILQAATMLTLLTGLTGLAYPLTITGIARVFVPAQSRGSAELIGSASETPTMFWSRPSATAPQPYDGSASAASNAGPLSETLVVRARLRLEALHAAGDVGAPPVDLVTASASGLDPHISPEAARYQAARIARARGVAVERVEALIANHIERRTAGLLGAPRVHVGRLNQALDALEREE